MAVDKKVLDEIQTVWHTMKGELDDAMAEVKKYGAAGGEMEGKLRKMETRLDELDVKLQRLPMAMGEQSDGKQEVKEKKRVFFETLRRGSVQALEPEDQELAKKYKIGPVGRQEVKALALGDDTTGGFLAPPEFVNDIIEGVQLISPIRGVATVRQTSRRSIMYPVRAGVMAAQWIGETATRTETTGLAVSMEEIPTYEMYAEVLVSEQDLEDSVFDLEGFIRDNITEQFAKAEGAAFVVGDGLKKPEGYMNASGISVDLSGAAGTIASAAAGSPGQGDGLIQCAFNIKTAYAAGAVWTMNRKSVGKVRRLADSQGRYLWEPAYATGTGTVTGASILGIPYIEVPDMQDEGASNFPIMLGNFKRGAILVDRVDLVFKRLVEKYAEQGQIAIIGRKRVGFQVVLPEAFRKYKSNNS